MLFSAALALGALTAVSVLLCVSSVIGVLDVHWALSLGLIFLPALTMSAGMAVATLRWAPMVRARERKRKVSRLLEIESLPPSPERRREWRQLNAEVFGRDPGEDP